MFDQITNNILEKRIAEVLIKRKQKLQEQGVDVEDDINSLPSNLSYDREKYEKLQSDRYLSSGSNFLKLSFQYAIPMDDVEEKEVPGNLIEIDESHQRELNAIAHNKALDPSSPLFINESTFRMVIVTDETYSSFFDNELWMSFKVNDEVSNSGNSYGAMMSNLRGAVNVVMTSGQRVATEVKRQMDESRTRKDSIRSSRSIGSVGTLNSMGTLMPDNLSVKTQQRTSIDSKSAESIGKLESIHDGDDDDDFVGLLSPTLPVQAPKLTIENDDGDGDFDDGEEFGSFIPAESESQPQNDAMEKIVTSLIDL